MAKQERASCWSVTINNPTQTDEYNIQSARQKGWKVEGQLEKGSEGTPHYQLIVKTPQVRFSAIKKQFPRAHIEIARNAKALEQYVNKEETRAGSLPESSDLYPSLAKLWDLFAEWMAKHYEFHEDEHWMMRPINDENERLKVFDRFIADSIVKGYHVETMGVNPQIRSCVKNYLPQLIKRSRINIRRQTDRQTDENLVEYIDIPNASEEGDEEVSTASSVSS